MYNFAKITPSDLQWKQIADAIDATVFHLEKWFDYLRIIHGYAPFLVEVRYDDIVVAYFLGEKAWFGVRVLESPIMGKGTYTQGLVALQPISLQDRVLIYKEFADWVFRSNIAQYIKIDDWALRVELEEWKEVNQVCCEALKQEGISYLMRPTYVVELTPTEEDLWASFHYKSCKYSINKALKNGLYVTFIDRKEDIPAFVNLLFEQICDVSTRKSESKRDYQSVKKLQCFCESLFPDNVLMYQVWAPSVNGEEVVASGVFGIGRQETIYWAGASYARCQKLCPNELAVWESMKEIKRRGSRSLNMGGLAPYKKKYGSRIAYIPRFEFKKHSWVFTVDQLAKSLKLFKRSLIS